MKKTRNLGRWIKMRKLGINQHMALEPKWKETWATHWSVVIVLLLVACFPSFLSSYSPSAQTIQMQNVFCVHDVHIYPLGFLVNLSYHSCLLGPKGEYKSSQFISSLYSVSNYKFLKILFVSNLKFSTTFASTANTRNPQAYH